MLDFLVHHRPRFVLLVGDDGALLVPFDREGKLPVLFAASRDDEARGEILACLNANPDMPVIVLANDAAQEFRIETLPPLNFADRLKLVRRRLRQGFPQAYAVASRTLDRTRMMMGCVRQGSPAADWLADMPTGKLTLGLLPVESAGLLAQLVPEAKKGWAILLAQFGTGGLRQIVTCDGQVVFTRQTRALPDAAESKAIINAILRVLDDTRGYLARFGLTDGSAMRAALILGGQAERLLHDAANHNIVLFSPRQVAEKLPLPFLLEDETADSDLIFAGWVAMQGKLYLPVMPRAIKRSQWESSLAVFGIRAACVVFVFGICLFGMRAEPLAVSAYENFRAGREVAAMRQQMIEQEAALAPVAQPLGRLRAALERQRLFTEPAPQPWDVLRQLGDRMGGAARLTRFDWRDDQILHADIRIIAAKDASPSDHEALVRDFEELAQKLAQAMPDYTIEVAHYPFPAKPEETLSNSGMESGSAPDIPVANFTIRKKS